MAWHEDQPTRSEGFDSIAMMNLLQVWLPIRFSTKTTKPIAEQKLFVELKVSELAKVADESKAAISAKHTLSAENRDVLRTALGPYANSDVGFVKAAIAAGLKLALPSGWVASAVAGAVSTLFGYLVSSSAAKEKASFLSANLAAGGELRELWHKVEIAVGKVYFYRVIEYEVIVGAETRQFVLLSVRYALKAT